MNWVSENGVNIGVYLPVPYRNGVVICLRDGRRFDMRARGITSDKVVSALFGKRAEVEITRGGKSFTARYHDDIDRCVHEFVGTLFEGELEVPASADSHAAKDQWVTHNDWVQHLEHFIPKSMLEPWFGDLLEARANMAREGRGAAYIRCAVAAQILFLLANAFKSGLLDLMERVAAGVARAAK
jgi:hypothetical protein